jgi:hypothetical protein
MSARLMAKAGALSALLLLAASAISGRADSPTPENQKNPYPTSALADYVLGCMAANNNTHESLFKCSCAIDTIASLMPYSRYEEAETALSMQAGGGIGGRVGEFRDPPMVKEVLEQLRRSQAEANLKCF